MSKGSNTTRSGASATTRTASVSAGGRTIDTTGGAYKHQEAIARKTIRDFTMPKLHSTKKFKIRDYTVSVSHGAYINGVGVQEGVINVSIKSPRMKEPALASYSYQPNATSPFARPYESAVTNFKNDMRGNIDWMLTH